MLDCLRSVDGTERGAWNSKRPRWLLGLVWFVVSCGTGAAADVLVPAGGIWRYLDDGSNQGTAWRGEAFDDSAWRFGPAQLGYGDYDEATTIRSATDSGERIVTTYFRHAFAVAEVSAFTNLSLELLRDDGAVVYLNELELFRSNMPTGPVNYRTLAATSVGGGAESTFYPVTVSVSNLLNGLNILAVEVHQSATNSSDVSFDLRLSGVRPPRRFTVVSPPEGLTADTTSVTLEVLISPAVSGSATATFYGRMGAPQPGPDFTLVAIPDTQYYVAGMNGGTPAMFTAQTDWIVANREARNIVFATQLGDCVEHGDNSSNAVEWLAATNALYRLENPLTTLLPFGIPYGVAVGNHDQSPAGSASGTTVFYNQYFGEAHFAGRDYYGGHFGNNNDNHYELFSASGLDFIIVHLEYDPAANRAVLSWANELLQAHASRRAIVVTHWLINAGNPGSFSSQGQAIYTALRTNANLFLMLGGHCSPEEGQRQDTFNGRTVYSLMSDYQSRSNGGNGWMRLMEFSPTNNVIRIRTYSPTLDQFETDADSQFDLPYDMRTGPPFTVLSSASAPGYERFVMQWSGLPSASRCEWWVSVSDGGNVATSPVWHFDTAPPAAPGVSIQLDRGSGRVHLTWPSPAEAMYRIVCKQSLTDPGWQEISTDVPSAGTTTSWSETMSPLTSCRIYRVRRVR